MTGSKSATLMALKFLQTPVITKDKKDKEKRN